MLVPFVLVSGVPMNAASIDECSRAAFYPTEEREPLSRWMLGMARFAGIADSFL